MDNKKVFNILGIAVTKDMRIIKNAYRGKLVQVNPEDDPEGFKILREAYEEAMRLTNVEEEERDIPDTPITKWIKKVESMYNKLSCRINIACWKELFDDEVCKDFDTSTEAREAFLEFLMDHFRLPVGVWQLIEDTFQFVDSKEELCEKFPEGFVDFITEDAKRKGWMDYNLFQGDDNGDIDEFISLYLSLRKMNDSNQYDESEEVFRKLEQINLWHPYLEAEKIRYFIAHKRLEEAKEIAENLKLKNGEDLYVKYYIAELYLEDGDLESAYAECKAILEVDPSYFGAKVLLSAYHLKKEEYSEAKEGYLDLLEIDSYNEKLHEGLQKSNIGLINNMKEQLEREPNNKALKLELAWCFFQNKLFEECIALTDDLVVDDEIYYDYYNLMSRTYLELGQYEKGFQCVEKWLAEILKTDDDGTKETKRRFQRLGLAYYFMSRCYYQFGTEKEDKKEEFGRCIQYIDLAIGAEQNTDSVLMYLSAKAQVLLELGEDKISIDVCDEILRKDKGYYPAYVLRQEAYFNLKMAEEVIDDYYNAIGIYPGNVSPYLFAARVYILYKQYEDAATVFKKAKEAGVESNELLFIELKNRRLMTSTNEERKKVAVELEKLYAKSEKEPGDLKETADLIHEQALCYYDMNEDEFALKVIEKKLGIKQSKESMMLKGDILYYLKRYEEGAAVYKEILRENLDYVDGYYKIGLCYNALGKEREALDNYLIVIKNDPEHPYVNSELMEIYKRHYLKSYRQEDYCAAVEYGKRQVEINPNCYYYTDLGLMYLEGYDMKEAMKAFQEASKYDDTNPYPYNNIGYGYKVLGDFDKAYEYYNLAIERIDDRDLLPYWNMAIYYRSTEQYEKAVETYEMIATKNDDSIIANKKILEVYKQMKAWEQALMQAKKIFELDEDEEMEYLLESGDICSFAGDEDRAQKFYKLAVKKYSRKSKPYIKMGNYLLWIASDKKKALKYYKKAYKIARRYDLEEPNQEDALLKIVTALKALGKEKKGVRYVEEIDNLYKRWYGSIETWLNNPEYRKIRLYYVADWNYNIGQYEKAQHYIDLMKETLNCAQCTYCSCYEYLELEGMMLELKKDYLGALEKYQRAFHIAPDNMHYLCKIKELKEKTEAR